MDFPSLYLLAASIIAGTGLLFFVFGIRQLSSRRFGLSWASLLREARLEVFGKRQASGRGTGLYFAAFGAFLIIFCAVATVLMLAMQGLESSIEMPR